jgi:hypothetical protein
LSIIPVNQKFILQGGVPMYDALVKRGRLMEEIFFKKKDAELVKKLKELERMKETEEALTNVSGIRDKAVLQKLIELDVTPPVLASLSVIPLIEVAWADGKIDGKEKEAVLRAAAELGFIKESIDHSLLAVWLEEPPPARLLEAWIHYINSLCSSMEEKDRISMRNLIVERARKVAEATGGFLGLGSKVSKVEEAVLKKMESAFC